MFDNTIDNMLFLSITLIIGLWLYQYKTNNGKSNTDTLSALDSKLTNSNLIADNSNNNKMRLYTNHRGIAVGFHEQFKRVLPELGWRSFYQRNYSGINSVNPTSQTTAADVTDGTIVNNYTKCLDNTDNVYKYVDY